MLEHLDRREFFKIGGWLGASAAVASADAIFARRIDQEKHPLNQDVIEALDSQAELIIPHIIFRNFELAKNMEASGYNLIPKPKGFAQMILTMAYYEGGKEAVDKTVKAISDRGLEIVLGQTSRPGVLGEVINPLLTPGQPYHLTVEPAYLFSDAFPLTHETYHVHQFIRDGEKKSILINVSLSSCAFVLINSLISFILNKENNLSRRSFLSKVLQYGISTVLFYQASPFLVPYENQAHTQTSGNIPDTLSADPYFQFSQTDLFDLKK